MTAHGMPASSVATSAPCAPPTGNLVPLLHEIRHALTRWLEQGEEHVIDLRSIPLAPGEEDSLLEQLGEGEVNARLSVLGPSDIIETRYPGVWLITHYNESESIIGRGHCRWPAATGRAVRGAAITGMPACGTGTRDPLEMGI